MFFRPRGHALRWTRAGGKIWESEVQRANRLRPVKRG
jgi:hypothetical protein